MIALPGLEIETEVGVPFGLNDVSFTRKPHGRVAELSYRLGGKEVGHVRCDGLVAATPAGSTGYNLANQGPILAWGVEGYVVSFIAPHTLTARPLVVAPDDTLEVRNAEGREPVDVSLDGEPVSELPSGESLAVRFRDDVGALAQFPGANFYRRMREKFGHLAGDERLTMGDPSAGAPRAAKHWWPLVAVSIAAFMLLLDVTVVNVALPDIQSELGASFDQLQWVIDAYALTLAATMLIFGSLADRFGRRRLFTIGLAAFSLASLACGLAWSPLALDILRGFQGLGGAAMLLRPPRRWWRPATRGGSG